MKTGFKVFVLMTTCLQAVLGANDLPCGEGWLYSPVSGKCYKFISSKKTWTEANTECGSVPGAYPLKTALATTATFNDMFAVTRAAGYNREVQWVGGKLKNGIYKWQDETSVEVSSYWKSSGAGNCVTLTFKTEFINGVWKIVQQLSKADCSAKHGFFCEYKAKACPYPVTHGQFNADSMVLSPNRTYVATFAHINCKDGFYRDSQLKASTSTSTSGANEYNCNGTAASNKKPEAYVTKEKVVSIEECHPISCGLPAYNVTNVEKQPTIPPGKSFAFGTSLPVDCILGHVDHQDLTQIKSKMVCKQSKRNPDKGYWFPGDFTPCIGVRCNSTQLFEMEPLLGTIVRAVNKKTQEEYAGKYQKSELNKYDNIVTITCNDGYFFDDRQPSKTIICGLKENSRTVGEWKGYQGTKLPLSKKCEAVSCKYQEVQPKGGQNIQEIFAIRYPDGKTERVSKHSGDDYKHNTVVQFWCNENFESANRNNDQNITCGPQGDWVPKLTPCIQRSEEFALGGKKHYKPPPKDAPQANSIGVIVISLLVIFFTFIIVLDLSTLTRDVKTLKANVIHLRDRVKYRSRKGK